MLIAVLLIAVQEVIGQVVPPPVPKLPPALPKLPNVQPLLDPFAAHLAHVNTGLFLTGLWVGAVTVVAVWFVVERILANSNKK